MQNALNIFFTKGKTDELAKIPYDKLLNGVHYHCGDLFMYRGVFNVVLSGNMIMKIVKIYGVDTLMKFAPDQCFRCLGQFFPMEVTRGDFELASLYEKHEGFQRLFIPEFKNFVARCRQRIITVFTVSVLFSDDYLTGTNRFFNIMKRLPQELQAVVAHRVYLSPRTFIDGDDVSKETILVLTAK